TIVAQSEIRGRRDAAVDALIWQRLENFTAITSEDADPHQAASLQVGKKRPNPLRAALCKASTARSPAANRVDPFEGLLPSVPSGLSNRTFPWMKRVPSASRAAACHHGALVLSGVSAMPWP